MKIWGLRRTFSFVIMDGKSISAKILNDLKDEISSLKMKNYTSSVPTLGYLVNSSNAGSFIYYKKKEKTCHSIGIDTIGYDVIGKNDISELYGHINYLNANTAVNGILVQLPIFPGANEAEILDKVSLEKDIDGLTRKNMGMLFMKNSEPLFYPCTALGVFELIKSYGINPRGLHTVIIGRSNLCGLPLFSMFQKANSTVTMCHTATQNLKQITSQADILVSAAGKANLIREDMVKDGSIVIDIGINKINTGEKSLIVGDVDYERVREKTKFITPVPGGVGPMTIAMLLKNLVKAWKRAQNF
ncbi:unnamed protein product [Blepharisma stoltei]|uniref:Methenyltetrahydrofolate cyclohydrolase n=1 Tax=Blepharisma stoltei TaxID=1481888 RepID=A0AAU9IVQ2_9CILI|nr:unnamed protein product [Blepharisma stoltei]